jgi:hypothetical protein
MKINQLGVSAVSAALGVLVISVTGVGVAVASNGGSLTIGHTNTATKVTTLSNKKGTVLSLKAGHGKAALKVNTTKQITHLNASLVGGSSAAQLKTSGSAAVTPFNGSKVGKLVVSTSLVASTAALSAGTYYVTAFVDTDVPSNAEVGCTLSTTDTTGSDVLIPSTESDLPGTQSISETSPVTVTAGQRIGFYCGVFDPVVTTTAAVLNAGLTAIRVDSSSTGTTLPGTSIEAFRKAHR